MPLVRHPPLTTTLQVMGHTMQVMDSVTLNPEPEISFRWTKHLQHSGVYPLIGQQAHKPYRRALGPDQDLLGVTFDPLAT